MYQILLVGVRWFKMSVLLSKHTSRYSLYNQDVPRFSTKVDEESEQIKKTINGSIKKQL